MSVARKRPPVQEQAGAAEPAPGAPEIEPTAGVSILEAIGRYAADQAAVLRWREYAFLRGRGRPLLDAMLRYSAYSDHFQTELLSNLCERKLFATGVWDAETSRRHIPADKLNGAKVDEIKNQIAISGHIIREVRIATAPPSDYTSLSSRLPVRQQDGAVIQVNMVTALPPKTRGPQGRLTQKAAQRMADDIISGAETPESLHALKRETLKTRYGVKSADTAVRALNLAIQIAENSNFGK